MNEFMKNKDITSISSLIAFTAPAKFLQNIVVFFAEFQRGCNVVRI